MVGEAALYTSAERWPHQCSVREMTIAGIWKFSFKNERDRKSKTVSSSNDFFLWDFDVEDVKIMKILTLN